MRLAEALAGADIITLRATGAQLAQREARSHASHHVGLMYRRLGRSASSDDHMTLASIIRFVVGTRQMMISQTR